MLHVLQSFSTNVSKKNWDLNINDVTFTRSIDLNERWSSIRVRSRLFGKTRSWPESVRPRGRSLSSRARATWWSQSRNFFNIFSKLRKKWILGTIQKIRDTLWQGRLFEKVSHELFLLCKTLINFNGFESKKFWKTLSFHVI